MNLTTRILAIAAGLAMVGVLTPAARGDGVDPFSLLIENVKKAETPSEAVAAYASALSVNRKSVRLHEAYIRRMIDFGLADLTYYQARVLVDLDEDNGLAWGVIALTKAREDKMKDAFEAAERAAKKLPEDPFVLSIAGQLVAWLDGKPDHPDADAEVKEAAESLRKRFGLKGAFVEGYAAAKTAMEQVKAAEAEEAAKAEEEEPAAEEPVVEPVRVEEPVTRTTVNYIRYETPYYTSRVYYYPYAYYPYVSYRYYPGYSYYPHLIFRFYYTKHRGYRDHRGHYGRHTIFRSRPHTLHRSYVRDVRGSRGVRQSGTTVFGRSGIRVGTSRGISGRRAPAARGVTRPPAGRVGRLGTGRTVTGSARPPRATRPFSNSGITGGRSVRSFRTDGFRSTFPRSSRGTFRGGRLGGTSPSRGGFRGGRPGTGQIGGAYRGGRLGAGRIGGAFRGGRLSGKAGGRR